MERADKEFNLLLKPWIRVMKADASVEERTLPDALVHAHEYVSLAGEMPTQDVAVLRLLLAVMHAVFYRVDAHGNDDPVEDSEKALERWKELWELGALPEAPIRAYLDRYKERFWLFHPERPFYQARFAEIGTEYGAAKLNGEISESGHKQRFFPIRAGKDKDNLTYAEAARWLLYVNGYDDTSSKQKSKEGKLPSIQAGWLGKLGLITANGKNLFETLMLNFVLFDEKEEIWGPPCPIWEVEKPCEAERVEILIPDNQAALLTLQSRRLLLERSGGYVTGYRLLGGDFFRRENAFIEQMTLWCLADRKNVLMGYIPRRHDASKKLWREFFSMIGNSQTGHCPGVVTWHRQLRIGDEPILDLGRQINYQVAAVQYGDKDFFITDAFSDTLSFHLNLLDKAGEAWCDQIRVEVERCERLAEEVGRLAVRIRKAAGGSGKSEGSVGEKAKEQFFYRIDVPFRNWLIALDAGQGDGQRIDKVGEWRQELLQIAKRLGNEIVESAGPAAYAGRTIAVKDKEQKIFYSAPKEYALFLWRVKRLIEGE